MATKKPITKKTSTKKTAVKKSTAAKKPAAKRSRVSAVRALRSQVGLRSEETDFFTFRITVQTVYWLVLGLVVILFTIWIMQLQADIQTLYDQIDAATLEAAEL